MAEPRAPRSVLHDRALRARRLQRAVGALLDVREVMGHEGVAALLVERQVDPSALGGREADRLRVVPDGALDRRAGEDRADDVEGLPVRRAGVEQEDAQPLAL